MKIISSQAFKPGRVKLKEIGFDLYPTKVAGFFYVFFCCCCCFFFCCLLEGFIERVVVRGRGLGLLILKTMLNSESCR